MGEPRCKSVKHKSRMLTGRMKFQPHRPRSGKPPAAKGNLWHIHGAALCLGAKSKATQVPIVPSSDPSPSEKEIVMPPVNPVPEKISAHARAVPTFEVELLSMEDIYRAAGIPGPRKGYSA